MTHAPAEAAKNIKNAMAVNISHPPLKQLNPAEKIFYFIIGFLGSEFIALAGMKIGLFWGIIFTEIALIGGSILILKKYPSSKTLKVFIWGILIRSILELALIIILANLVFGLLENMIR